jgi:spore germination protein GerM
MGLISLIPEQSKLLSVNIKNGTAFLNFSEGFRFNSFGLEGYNAQLKQIVYTATEFSNIDSVQIMIEGKIKEYMGTEGGYIGSPLSRSDFP